MEREELQEILASFKDDVLAAVENKIGYAQQQAPQMPPEPQTPEDALVARLVNVMEERAKSKDKQVYDTMFSERLSSMITQYPAFGEYIEGTDDFGEKLIDRIKRVPDYLDRIKAMDTVFKSFASAHAGGSSADMRMTKSVREQVEKDSNERDEIKAKFAKGDMTLDEFTTQFFGTVDKQLQSMKG